MITFSRFTTHRLTVQLREASIDDAIYLTNLPSHLHEMCTTETLKRIVAPASDLKPGQVADPSMWTVQERAAVLAHYLVHTAEEGNPDFALGSSNKYSDYILPGVDHASVMDLGEYQGDHWFLQPLIGRGAECIERLMDSGVVHKNRIGWFLGAMACQLTRDKDESTEEFSEAKYEEYVQARVEAFSKIAQSDFNPLFARYWNGLKAQDHLLRLTFCDDGVNFDPAPEVSDQSPARFLPDSVVSDDTLRILGIAPEPEDGPDQV